MKKSKIFAIISTLLLASGALAGCGGNGGNQGGGDDEEELTGTALAVSKASKMTLDELKEASKKEFEEQPNETFKVVGLTSLLQKAMKQFAKKYNWVHYGEEGEGAQPDNVYLKNDYKDYSLLKALNTADEAYFADYALVQDARSFSAYIEDGILHNFVPSDWQSLGLKEEDTLPLKGVHFNKLFWTNTNFEQVTGKKLENIWQLAGTADDAKHLSKISFQTPVTEQINMSFLVSCYAKDNQKRIEDAYEHYYGKKWSSKEYESAGDQWVDEFLGNITTWHASDGTAMKQTQLRDDWGAGVVYYGAFAKMKDAVAKTYDVDLNGNGVIDETLENYKVSCGGVDYAYTSEKNINAMTTVKWDWQIDGFNGFMYCMDSQIINNAKFPYTACLYARTLLEEDTYIASVFNSSIKANDGVSAANQYGYYYPGTISDKFLYAKGDWTKEKHIENEINEDYEYLKGVKSALVSTIIAKISK